MTPAEIAAIEEAHYEGEGRGLGFPHPLWDAIERVKADAWDAGHRDGCEDHMCELMGHLARNPYRTHETAPQPEG